MSFFKENRNKTFDLMLDNELLVLFCGQASVRLGDEDYEFTPNRNFYYLTGISQSEAVLVLFKRGSERVERLFIKEYDEENARWVPAPISEREAREKSGIDDISYLNELEEYLLDLKAERLLLDLACERKKQQRRIKKLLGLEVKDFFVPLARLRMIKRDIEILNIQRAIDITEKGIRLVMQRAAGCDYEYELEAYFDFALKQNAVKEKAFSTIMASGKNATILHYSSNSSPIDKSGLILMDLGATYNYYSGDISRTIPANGKFSQRQRQIYDIVLEGQTMVLDMIKEGVIYSSLNESLREYYCKELKKIGLITSDSELSEYYYHSVSHMLGLETHDFGAIDRSFYMNEPLKAGMVLTVEPGLYIAKEKIGVRIEEDVLVTENGCEILSKNIIKEPDEIEEFMKNE